MELRHKNYGQKTKTGFTLVETLVAITVLLIGVLGPIGVATRGITDGLYAQNQIIATYLAQEGLEMLSTQIKNNTRQSFQWLSGLDDCTTANGCSVTLNSDNSLNNYLIFAPCGAGASNCQLAYNASHGFYELSLGIGPVFTRILQVQKIGDKEAILSSEVDWFNKTTPKSFKISRYVFDKQNVP